MPTSTHDSPHDSPHDVDAVVVGAGFSGIYMTHQLSRRGLSVRAFEAGSTFGGTWFWNTYPAVWVVTTDGGEQVRARYAITAVGCLSTGQTPDFAGMDAFRGETYHTAAWP